MKIAINIIERLKEINILVEAPTSAQAEQIVDLLNQEQNSKSTFLQVKTRDGFEIVPIHEIYFIEVIKDELYIHLENRFLITRGRLYKLLDRLDQDQFIQVHKSFVIQLLKVSKLENSFSGNMSAVMKNNERINVSRRYLPALKAKIGT